MIKQQVIGRLGKDALVKDVNGKKVINFSIGTDVGYGENKKSLWVDCSKWGDQVGVAEYLKKGSMVYAEGEPSIKTYEGQNGFGASMLLRVDRIELLGSKTEQGATQHKNDNGPYATVVDDDPAQDLPF